MSYQDLRALCYPHTQENPIKLVFYGFSIQSITQLSTLFIIFGESDNLDLATFLLIFSLCLKRLEFSFANYFSSFLTLKILFFFLVLIFHSTVLISSLMLLFIPLLNCLYLSVILLRSSLA